MKYKLIDYTTNTKEDVTFGTCEMCMSTGTMTEQFFHIQDETGKIHKVEGYAWDWGDLCEIYIDNIPKFAAWLETQDITPPTDTVYGYGYNWLNPIADDYYEYSRLHDELLPWIENNVKVENNTMIIQVDENTYRMFNGFDFYGIMHHTVQHTDLDVQFDSYKPSDSDIIDFDNATRHADFSLSIDYMIQEVVLRVCEYRDNYRTKYTPIELGTAPGVLKIVFKEDNSFPDFSYEQR